MELKGYRDNLEQILEFTGGVLLLTAKDIRALTGLTDNRTIRRHFPVNERCEISAPALAGALCGGKKNAKKGR